MLLTAQSESVERHGGKSPGAFRTIAEVANDLNLPQHVLRFWETKFPQIKPLKRRGGRRYYRPEDVLLLRRIRSLLYVNGYTIKGVQKLLRGGAGHEPSEALERDDKGVQSSADAAVSLAYERRLRSELKMVLSELEALRDILRGR